MNNQRESLKWGTDYLVSQGYSIEHSPLIMLSTPWSIVARFSTLTGNIYLKETAPSLSLEPHIFRILSEKFNANVPHVLAINDDLHCFLTKDAGQSLREMLKTKFTSALLCQAIEQFGSLLRATATHIDLFLKLGVPDWRLDKLSFLYDQMINQTSFLKEEGITDKELEILKAKSPQFASQCATLLNYGMPETLGFHDFHDNNILIDPKTKKKTFIDFGETAIIHPFFSLYTCLRQSIKHHGVKEGDQTYLSLQEACFKNWKGLMTKDNLLKMFILAKQLWPVYSALDCYRLMMSVDLETYRSYYANRPSLIAGYLREYIEQQETKVR